MIRFFIILLIFFTSSIEAKASCACEEKPDVKSALSEAVATLKGKVEEVIWINPFDYLVKIYVQKSWKSIKSEYVWLASTNSEKECGFHFITGHEYLIYAYENTNNLLSATKCGRTIPWSEASYQEKVMLGQVIYSNEME